MVVLISFFRFLFCFIIFFCFYSLSTVAQSIEILEPHPSLLEFCVGDTVKMKFNDFNRKPKKVCLWGHSSTWIAANNPLINSDSANNKYSGTCKFIIPDGVTSGRVRFYDSLNQVVYDHSSLVINNPLIDFLPQKNPMCASDTVFLLHGFPSGGTFEYKVNSIPLSYRNVLDLLDALTLDSVTIKAKYKYKFFLSDTTLCPEKEIEKDIVVYNNNLDLLLFHPFIKDSGSTSRLLTLNSTGTTNMIRFIKPNIMHSGQSSYSSNFSGTYVDSNDFFLGNIAPIGDYPVTLEIDNHGCKGEITSDIHVYPRAKIIGWKDTLCEKADSYEFLRSTDIPYDSIRMSSSPCDSFNNKVIAVTTKNAAHQTAISIVDSTVGSEKYSINPSRLPLNTREVIVTMFFGNAKFCSNQNLNTIDTTFHVKDTVKIVPVDIVSILGLDTSYCANGPTDTLNGIPVFGYRTNFSLFGADAFGGYNISSYSMQSNVLDPSSIYDSIVPSSNRDLPMKLLYTANRYGCSDTAISYFTIRAPLEPFFVKKASYCLNEPASLLQRNFVTGGVQEFWAAAPGLDTISGLFSPIVAGVGYVPINYILKDRFGCEYTYKDTLSVREPPKISITLDGRTDKTSFCANPDMITIGVVDSQFTSGAFMGTTIYTGRGVSGNIFNPNSAFSGGGGMATIWVEAVDTLSCKVYDSIRVSIINAPQISLDTAFDNNHRINNLTMYKYCRYDSAFILNVIPAHKSNNNINTIVGAGVILDTVTGEYYYNPREASSNLSIDSVIYTYTDTIGCMNKDLVLVRLDTVPNVTLRLDSAVSSNLCPDTTAISLLYTPNPASSSGTSNFTGVGVDQTTHVFVPFIAGLGRKIITYRFTDDNNCSSTDTVRVYVNSLPVPRFDGYEYQYCTGGKRDTLNSLNYQGAGTSFWFYGNLIVDSIGVLQPDTFHTGPQKIYYTYTDTNNCSNVDSVNVYIHRSPKISFLGLDSAYCYSGGDIITVAPAGGALVQADSVFTLNTVNTIRLKPRNDYSGGVKRFTYRYSDDKGCIDSLEAHTYIYKPQVPDIIKLDAFYCEVSDTLVVYDSVFYASASNGILSGAGTWFDANDSLWMFIPSKAGVGTHVVQYKVDSSYIYQRIVNASSITDTLLCPADTTLMVRVKPLPVPRMISPLNNTRFCSNEGRDTLKPTSDNEWSFFRDTSRGVTFTIDSVYLPVNGLFKLVADTTYFFNPSSVSDGTHVITYITIDSLTGCRDSIEFTLIVDGYTEPSFYLDSIHCESVDSILLYGIPDGGTFFRNSVVVNRVSGGTAPYFYPNPNYSLGQYLTSTVYDTIKYRYRNGACNDSVSRIIQINPVPQISFQTDSLHNTYCLGGDTVRLMTTGTGGIFSGNGVPFQSNIFIPDLAGAGTHLIRYYYLDTMTSCDNEAIDTLYVYNMPNADFTVHGGCQLDTVRFQPNNAVLGLINNSQVVDSITSVKWIMSPTYSIVSTAQNRLIDTNGRTLDTVSYLYNTTGTYNTQLIVTNRHHCVDTQTVRLVISPKISSFPYEQDFEAGPGNWFAEDVSGSSDSLLWQWGADNNSLGIGRDLNNNIWETQNNRGYGAEENSWVYSPCFDLQALKRPMISLDYWTDTRSRADGTILEYQKSDGSWAPLGELNRGINWFNTPFIAADPGDDRHRVFPIGWSGQSGTWQNGRYKLDQYRGTDNILRLRFAFASLKNDPQRQYDGFAFDNVSIRERSRNVLLETMVHELYNSMEIINNRTYQLIHHTSLNKDVVLLQYHIPSPNGPNAQGATDFFHDQNPILGSTRSYEYNLSPAGRAFINGEDSTQTYATINLAEIHFEQDMLETPKFSVVIDSFTHINGNFRIIARVKALEELPTPATYRIYTVVSEDSLRYPNGSSYTSQVHAVARENDESHLGGLNQVNRYTNRIWAMGEEQRVEFNWNHYAHGGFINYQPANFHAVVFIQDIDTKEVFQVASTRDVSGYWVGVEPVQETKEELNEIQNVTLFPNPAHDYFNLSFEQVLKHDYKWKLVDIRGVEVRQGTIQAGNDQLQVQGLDCPAGTYIMLLYNDKVFTQRKVVLGRP